MSDTRQHHCTPEQEEQDRKKQMGQFRNIRQSHICIKSMEWSFQHQELWHSFHPCGLSASLNGPLNPVSFLSFFFFFFSCLKLTKIWVQFGWCYQSQLNKQADLFSVINPQHYWQKVHTKIQSNSRTCPAVPFLQMGQLPMMQSYTSAFSHTKSLFWVSSQYCPAGLSLQGWQHPYYRYWNKQEKPYIIGVI